jgi:predicted secreted protein
MSYTGSKAFSGQGTILSMGNGGSPETFTPVAELKTINFSGLKVDAVDVTNMESLNATREKLPTLIDSGEVNMTGNYIAHDSTQQALRTALQARSVLPWTVTLPEGSIQVPTDLLPGQFQFNGFLTELAIDLDVTKEATFTAKITITGVTAFVDESV